jgi:hypothetical protein
MLFRFSKCWFATVAITLLSLLPQGEKVRMRGERRSYFNIEFFTTFLTLTLTLSQYWERGPGMTEVKLRIY